MTTVASVMTPVTYCKTTNATSAIIGVCFSLQPEGTTEQQKGDNPIIKIKSVEKTDQRIEVEISSTILILMSWYRYPTIDVQMPLKGIKAIIIMNV